MTWDWKPPGGYVYNNTWIPKFCEPDTRIDIQSCLKDTHIKIVGDSTTRQMVAMIKELCPCDGPENIMSVKHAVICVNKTSNFTLTYDLPPLPYVNFDSCREYYKSFMERLDEIPDNERAIVVLVVYAHILGYHSHVYLHSIKAMGQGVQKFVKRNLRAQVFIKGPHAYSFTNRTDHVSWMPDAYAYPYAQLLYDVFKGLHDRVFYLNALDITIATEQDFIHPDEYVVKELVKQVLGFFCE